jgi:DNA-binding CsgD family transcriptional regulator
MTPAELAHHRTQGVITDREYDALLLNIKGLKPWTIAIALGISRWAVRDRLRNGYRKIELHQKENAA